MENLLKISPFEGVWVPQGQLAANILIPDETFADDSELVQAAVDYVNTVQETCCLVPGEYPEEALWSYCVDYYLAQVNNGGHSQFAYNSDMMPRTLRACRDGLKAMGADGHLAIFDAFLTIMAKADERALAIQESAGFGAIDEDVSALDSAFYALPDLTAINAGWLRQRPSLMPVHGGDLQKRFDTILHNNPMAQPRREQGERERDRVRANDPSYRAAEACASQEGVVFEHFTAGTPVGPDGAEGIEWGAVTDQGLRWLWVSPDGNAEWRTEGRVLKARYFVQTKGPYSEDVGDGSIRKSLSAEPSDAGGSRLVFTDIVDHGLRRLTDLISGDDQRGYFAFTAAHLSDRLHYIPRRAWTGFDINDEHADFRLLITAILVDSVFIHWRGMADGKDAKAFFIAAVAMAATGAAAIRLPSISTATRLKAQSLPDFKREVLNIWQQIDEVYAWWRQGLQRWQLDARSHPPKGILWFRQSPFERAAMLLKQGRQVEQLAGRMTYFDKEYTPWKIGVPDLAAISLDTVAAIRKAPGHANLNETIRVFRNILNDRTARDNSVMRAMLAEPHHINIRHRSEVIALISVETRGTGKVQTGMGVYFDKDGRRRPILLK